MTAEGQQQTFYLWSAFDREGGKPTILGWSIAYQTVRSLSEWPRLRFPRAGQLRQKLTNNLEADVAFRF